MSIDPHAERYRPVFCADAPSSVARIDAPSESVIPLARFAAVVFRGDLVPAGRDLNLVTLHGGVRVYGEYYNPSLDNNCRFVFEVNGGLVKTPAG